MKQTRLLVASPGAISEAAAVLREGGLVAFPTETVYGLGADARNARAVARIFEAKGRPQDNPLIVHVADAEACEGVAADIPETARQLMQRFWPGPLTLVLPRHASIPAVVSAGLDTVAVRLPDDEVARDLIRAAGVPVAAPSANLSGRPSPTTAQHVLADLGGRIEIILDGGPCPVGLESTVLDVSGAVPVLLRPGGVTAEAILAVAGRLVMAQAEGGPARSPGMRHRHYRPACEVVLVAPGEAAVRLAEACARGLRTGLLARADSVLPEPAPDYVRVIPGGVEAYAAALFDALREAEALVDVLVIETVPEEGMGRAVMDRLARAAGLTPRDDGAGSDGNLGPR